MSRHTPERFLATDLVVVTVTPTSAVINWTTRGTRSPGGLPRPVPAGTQLRLGLAGGRLRLVHDDDQRLAFHSVEVTGLIPGTRYRFEASSDGQVTTPTLRPTRASGSSERVGEFTTLTPPPGSYATTIAIVNDIHLGERGQGIVLGPLPTAVRPDPGQPDYSRVLFEATLTDLATRRDRPFLLANGDITYDNTAEQAELGRRLLDGYGMAGRDWVATRGNHDRPYRDRDPFGELIAPYQELQLAEEDAGLRVLAMDSTRGSAGGWITEPQYEQITAALQAEPERPTLAATHHPVTRDAAWSSPSGPQFMLRGRDRVRLQAIERDASGVFLHVAGHTHRMRRDRASLPGAQTRYLETAACAAYPVGYTLLHLFTGGYLVNFWRVGADETLDWIMRSRWQVLGIGAHLMLGSTADRNHVVRTDLSALKVGTRSTPSELIT